MSARLYAKRRAELGLKGATHSAVLKAIRAGRLERSATKRGRSWSIDAGLADLEWEETKDHGQDRGHGTPERRPQPGAGPLFGEELEDEGRELEEDDRGAARAGRVTQAEATRMRAGYQALLARLDYELRSGKVVEKAQVQVELYTAARNLRDVLFQIAPRLAGTLAPMTSETEIEQAIDREIREALESFARSTGRVGLAPLR